MQSACRCLNEPNEVQNTLTTYNWFTRLKLVNAQYDPLRHAKASIPCGFINGAELTFKELIRPQSTMSNKRLSLRESCV